MCHITHFAKQTYTTSLPVILIKRAISMRDERRRDRLVDRQCVRSIYTPATKKKLIIIKIKPCAQ